MATKIHIENADEDCTEKIRTNSNNHGSIRSTNTKIAQEILNDNSYEICLKCWTNMIKRDYE